MQQSAYDMLKLAVIGMSLLTCGLWFIRDELALMTNDAQVRLSSPLSRFYFCRHRFHGGEPCSPVAGVFLGAVRDPMWSYLFRMGSALPLSGGWDIL